MKSARISPIFVWILVFFLKKTSTIHISNFCSGMPLRKVHELTFFGLVCRGDSWSRNSKDFRDSRVPGSKGQKDLSEGALSSSWTFYRGIPEQNFNVNRACFPKEKHQDSQKRAKFMNFSFWPFVLVWFAGTTPDTRFLLLIGGLPEPPETLSETPLETPFLLYDPGPVLTRWPAGSQFWRFLQWKDPFHVHFSPPSPLGWLCRWRVANTLPSLVFVPPRDFTQCETACVVVDWKDPFLMTPFSVPDERWSFPKSHLAEGCGQKLPWKILVSWGGGWGHSNSDCVQVCLLSGNACEGKTCWFWMGRRDASPNLISTARKPLLQK